MAFQPLTYAGQYPPLSPRSPSDVSSFDLLHAALRKTHPELAREGDKILNEEMLARLVDGARRFQRDHLGRRAKSKYWPTLRLPDVLFSDRSSAGPLATAVLAAFRIKQISPWRNFNFDNPKLFDDNISIIKKIEGDLLDRGFLKRPVLYFDSTVEEGLGKPEAARLAKIAQRFGATVVEDYPNKKVTHVVAYDPEEHDAKDVMEEEERREKAGEDIERTYLKTLVVVDMPLEEEGHGGGDDGGQQKRTKKMALVHWWYHPSSYDEWMAAEDVSGDVEEPFHPGIPGGPAVVGCKFVRDVEKFNEWGVEADYAVMEYERKLACLRKESNKPISSSKRSSKKRRSSITKHGSSVLENVNNHASSLEGPAAKKQRLHKEEQKAETKAATEKFPSSSTAASRNKGGSSKSKPPKKQGPSSGNIQSFARQASDRRRPEGRAGGMNPRRIVTGIPGPRHGEVLRRTVFDGALRVEEEPYRVVRDALADYLLGGDRALVDGKERLMPPTLASRPERRRLLPPTGFVRPSVDAGLGKCMMVVELTCKSSLAEEESSTGATGESADGVVASALANKFATVAVQRSVPILALPTADVGAGEGNGGEPLSIRGGGNGIPEGGEPADAGTGLPHPREEEEGEEKESNQPIKGGDDEATQVAVEDGAPRDTTTEEFGNLESTTASESIGTTGVAAPVADAQVDLKEDAMQVDRPAGVVEGAASEEDHQVEEISKKSSVESAAVGAVGEESRPPAATKESTPKAPSPETESTRLADPSPPAALPASVPAADGDGNAERVTEDPSLPKAPVASVGAVGSSDVLKQPSQVATAVARTSEAQVSQTNTSTVTNAQVAPSTALALTATVEVSSSAVTSDAAPKKEQPPAATALAAAAPAAVCKVVSLPPGTQLSSSLHRPTAEEDPAKPDPIVAPAWYDPSAASGLERRLLPEWFDGSAPHRTTTSYVQTREGVLDLARRASGHYLTAAAVRRHVAGDVGSLLRLHHFLEGWGMLNGGSVGETAPGDLALRGLRRAPPERKRSRVTRFWSASRLRALEESVVRRAADPSNVAIDWDAIAADVGDGASAEECRRTFVEPPAGNAEQMADSRSRGGVMLSCLLDGVRPETLKATIDAALQSTSDIAEARQACVAASLAALATERGAAAEAEAERILLDIVDQRVQRLENRAALLDDVEALLEAERVSLELERRDMYTARCRHWFGDGSS